ncbi:DegQ family serine endoprotease [Neisseria sp. Ec49-e6-T10]|uniref:DegQ family serine endoprotease n=1 Tax=Neisseria sp. Ec49-e6-T10 TaxID=3140744 RepID=UPI003EBA22C9
MKKILSTLFFVFCLSCSVLVKADTPDFTSLVETQGKAVVNINTTQTVKQRQIDPFFEFFGQFAPPQVREYQARSLGSGFIISADGFVMTNAHVVAKADEITVTLTDKREYQAKLIGADARTDVALLKIDAKGLPTVKIGDPDNLRVGEWVIAIGSPFGFENSVSAGIVSAKGRQLPREDFVPFIQTDVAVNPGNSGGPLFNLKGEVVGMNSQIYSQSGGFMGISFAIPIDVATRISEELKTQGHVRRGRLGVYIQEMTKELAESFGLSGTEGALISQVEKGAAADKAGLKSGDIVLKVGEQTIKSSSDLPRIIGNTRPDTQVILQVLRAGKTISVPVKVEENKDTAGIFANRAPQEKPETKEAQSNKVGMVFQNLNVREMKQLNDMGFSFGVFVVNPGSAGKNGQIRRGDVVVGVAGQPLKNGQQLLDAINRAPKNSKLALQVLRQGSIQFVVIQVEGQ